MQPQAGYYSLVQFCPNFARLEAVNVGVLLFCPASGFLDIRLNEDNDRVAKVFGKDAFHPTPLEAAKRGLAYRLTQSEDRPKTREELERFISARGDAVQLIAPRPLVTDDPAKDLEELFQTLVVEPEKPSPSRPPV